MLPSEARGISSLDHPIVYSPDTMPLAEFARSLPSGLGLFGRRSTNPNSDTFFERPLAALKSGSIASVPTLDLRHER